MCRESQLDFQVVDQSRATSSGGNTYSLFLVFYYEEREKHSTYAKGVRKRYTHSTLFNLPTMQI